MTSNISSSVMSLVVGGNCVLSRSRTSFTELAQRGVGVEEGLGDDRRHVEVVDLLVEGPALRLHRRSDGVEVAVLLRPDREARERVLLGEPGAVEEHRQERQAHRIALARAPACRPPTRARRGACPAVDSSVRWSRMSSGSVTSSRARSPSGQLDIAPQVLEDTHEVRLAAAVEAADPHRRLLRLAQVGEEAVEDLLEAAGVLALADEAAQLPAQHVPLLVGLRPDDLGDAVVRDLRLRGVSVEELPVRDRHRPLPFGVIGNGEVVPAVTRIEQPVAVAFVLAREEDEQAAGDGVVHGVQQGRDLDGVSEPEERARAEERHDAVRRGVRGKLRAHVVDEVHRRTRGAPLESSSGSSK